MARSPRSARASAPCRGRPGTRGPHPRSREASERGGAARAVERGGRSAGRLGARTPIASGRAEACCSNRARTGRSLADRRSPSRSTPPGSGAARPLSVGTAARAALRGSGRPPRAGPGSGPASGRWSRRRTDRWRTRPRRRSRPATSVGNRVRSNFDAPRSTSTGDIDEPRKSQRRHEVGRLAPHQHHLKPRRVAERPLRLEALDEALERHRRGGRGRPPRPPGRARAGRGRTAARERSSLSGRRARPAGPMSGSSSGRSRLVIGTPSTMSSRPVYRRQERREGGQAVPVKRVTPSAPAHLPRRRSDTDAPSRTARIAPRWDISGGRGRSAGRSRTAGADRSCAVQ